MKIKYNCIIFNDCEYMRKFIDSGNPTIYGSLLTRKQIKDFINKGFSIAIKNYGIVQL
jgi:hypothetical protein